MKRKTFLTVLAGLGAWFATNVLPHKSNGQYVGGRKLVSPSDLGIDFNKELGSRDDGWGIGAGIANGMVSVRGVKNGVTVFDQSHPSCGDYHADFDMISRLKKEAEETIKSLS